MVAKIGRPSKYSKEWRDKICEHLISGKSLTSFCKEDGNPSISMVFRWLQKHKAFREQYRYAREVQAQVLFDQCVDIADDSRNDFMEKVGRNGEVYEAVDHENINRSRLRIDTRQYAAKLMAPKLYNDRYVDPDDAALEPIPVKIEIAVVDGKVTKNESN